MKVASWNVNSINSRLARLVAFLERNNPDVVCLQELKCLNEKFPYDVVKGAGYHAEVFGQKTYNGVAILSKRQPEAVRFGFGKPAASNSDAPLAARTIAVTIDGTHFISAYVPNGQAVGSEKYQYKMQWLQEFRQYLEEFYQPTDHIVLAGDFNVARDDRDVHDPGLWSGSIMCSPGERAGLEAILNFGFKDTFRMHVEEAGHFSWWDYRALAFPLGNGLRIDYIFATMSLAERCTRAAIERGERKGAKPSDHAPVLAEFDVPES